MRTPSLGWAGVVGAVLLLAAEPPAVAGAEEGRPIYVAKCQACHGATGRWLVIDASYTRAPASRAPRVCWYCCSSRTS